METRKITIANTRDQQKHVVMTAATTLGELKRDLDAHGINYAEMDFIEALSKTQLRGDDSVLPHDVPYNHTVTNELVFLLTTPNRKIKSGISRIDVYEKILNREDCDELKEAIKNHFGRNYTTVLTSDLEDFVSMWNADKDIENAAADVEQTLDERVAILENTVSNMHRALMEIIDILDGDYCVDDAYVILSSSKQPKDTTVYSAGMTADDIDELINSNI